MCELLGINSRKRIYANALLKSFYQHSEIHSHGWGLAISYGDAVQIEKEPIKAIESNYLHFRLNHQFEVETLIAHIRLASVGRLCYENCHPFVRHDNHGRGWTLAHNGTIFVPALSDGNSLDKYIDRQEGSTDSERILYYIVDSVNAAQERAGRALEREERFRLIDRLVTTLSAGNKLNLLIWDGECLYIHTNYVGTLYRKHVDETESTVISTKPLDDGRWEPVPMLQLHVYSKGELIWQGNGGSREYYDKEDGWEYKNCDYSLL